ncbi:hypothetical protein [Shouchella hunanensis]|uniref:Lipoprotein n=1 Tax=Shouchella hunanensis TaxID=766894 RepID=A0ABY7W3U7_9BACI|nr:hypothetical protein [Shouchella hunanensis]WDF03637.1 hypothetical protein PQ477_19435 [Shouchella hunanensis]
MFKYRIKNGVLVSGVLAVLTACDSTDDLIGHNQKPDGYIPSSPIEFVEEDPAVAQ